MWVVCGLMERFCEGEREKVGRVGRFCKGAREVREKAGLVVGFGLMVKVCVRGEEKTKMR